jgi:hypothetical protein
MVGSELSTSMVTWYRVHPAMGGKWIVNFDGNMVQSTLCYGWEVNWQHQQCVLCTMLPLRLWIHFPPIAVRTLYHVTIEVDNSLPTHSRCTTSMVTWYRVHTAMGGKCIDNFNGNMVQSTLCYGWEVNSQHKWWHGTEYTLVTIEVVNSLPTHSSVYSIPCYHWSCQFTSHP